ncbi:grancalcin [Cariama cristata]
MPGMPVTMGQPMPGAVPNMSRDACSGCSAYAGTCSAASDPMLTYFSAIAGQPHRLRDGSGFCGANMLLLKNIDLQKQRIGRCPIAGWRSRCQKNAEISNVVWNQWNPLLVASFMLN